MPKKIPLRGREGGINIFQSKISWKRLEIDEIVYYATEAENKPLTRGKFAARGKPRRPECREFSSS